MNRTALRACLTLTAALTMGLAPTATASAASGQMVYTGQAQITLGRYGFCGAGAAPVPLGKATYTAPVTMTVSDSPSGENNPVHFTLQTTNQNGTGAWSITTSYVAATSGGGLTVQYWTDRYDSSTGRLVAKLTDDHVRESLAYNLINIEQMLIPCRPEMGTIPMVAPMGVGSELAGTLTASEASLQVQGVSSDKLTQYAIAVEVKRRS